MTSGQFLLRYFNGEKVADLLDEHAQEAINEELDAMYDDYEERTYYG